MLRGIGKQKFGAILNAVAYYGVGMPLAAVLLFVARIGVMGTDPWALHPQTPQGQLQLHWGLTTTLVPGSVPPLTCPHTGLDWDGSCSCWELLLGKITPKQAPMSTPCPHRPG